MVVEDQTEKKRIRDKAEREELELKTSIKLQVTEPFFSWFTLVNRGSI